MRRVWILGLLCLGTAVAENNVWISNGPYSGDVKTIAIDYANPSIVYAGLLEGGVYKTNDGGQNWSPINQGLLDQTVQVIRIDPSANQIVYAGTKNGGFYKSVDGG